MGGKRMNEDKSAFPVFDSNRAKADYGCIDCGLSIKQYAAIRLKVPRSGDPEIDAMIRESRRMDFAGQALSGGMSGVDDSADAKVFAEAAYEVADAMLAEWEKEAGNVGEA
jgi:hypothetical protein